MTDLTTAHLQHLLDQAETMPWKSSVEVYGVPEGWDEWGLALNTGRFWLSTWSPGPVSEEELDCLELAALAPQLAQEVIQLREHIEELITVMEVKAIAGVPQYPAAIANCLKEIVLGDHDE